MADQRSNPPQHYIEKPIFAGARAGLMQCASGDDCDWVFFGPREKFQAAWTEHWRLAHSEEVGVVFTHGSGSRLADVLAMQNRQPEIVIAR